VSVADLHPPHFMERNIVHASFRAGKWTSEVSSAGEVGADYRAVRHAGEVVFGSGERDG
jgi:hypothetical protein